MAEPFRQLTITLSDRYRIEREFGAGGMDAGAIWILNAVASRWPLLAEPRYQRLQSRRVL
jgi:hypothetical protein